MKVGNVVNDFREVSARFCSKSRGADPHGYRSSPGEKVKNPEQDTGSLLIQMQRGLTAMC